MARKIIYETKNVTVEVERVFTAGKSKKELIFELLRKRIVADGLRL